MIKNKVGDQLAMFLDPKEIIKTTFNDPNWTSGDLVGGNFDDLWEEKLTESYSFGYIDSIADWVVFDPIVIKAQPNLTKLGNGHHRIISAATVGIPLIPVVWTATQTFATISTRDDNGNEF
jgi:hypothetical protein